MAAHILRHIFRASIALLCLFKSLAPGTGWREGCVSALLAMEVQAIKATDERTFHREFPGRPSVVILRASFGTRVPFASSLADYVHSGGASMAHGRMDGGGY